MIIQQSAFPDRQTSVAIVAYLSGVGRQVVSPVFLHKKVHQDLMIRQNREVDVNRMTLDRSQVRGDDKG